MPYIWRKIKLQMMEVNMQKKMMGNFKMKLFLFGILFYSIMSNAYGQKLEDIINVHRTYIITNMYVFQSLRWYKNFETQEKYTQVNSCREHDFLPEDTNYYINYGYNVLSEKKIQDSCYVLVKLERLNNLVSRQYFPTVIPGISTQILTRFTSSFDSIDRRVGLLLVDTCQPKIYYIDGPFILDNTSFLFKNIKDEREKVCAYSAVRFYLQEPSMIDVNIKNKTIIVNTKYNGIFRFSYELDGDYIVVQKISEDK
jgi:hypothetical protein